MIFYQLSTGKVSYAQLNSELEQQLSSALGDDHKVTIEKSAFSFGQNGLLSLNATNVKVFKNETTNLGVAREVLVEIKLLPLLKGKVQAKSIVLKEALVSVLPFLTETQAMNKEQGRSGKGWPQSLDFSKPFYFLQSRIEQFAKAFNAAGLERLSVSNVRLIGVEQLALDARSAYVSQLTIDKKRNFQEGLFVKTVLQIDNEQWQMAADWQAGQEGGNNLVMRLEGGKTQKIVNQLSSAVRFDAPLVVRLNAPYNDKGQVQQSLLTVEIGGSEVWAGEKKLGELEKAQVNLRFIPEKNQIELERSPIKFKHASTVLIGGLRYPANNNEDSQGKDAPLRPLFQLGANDVKTYGDNGELIAGNASLNVDGWIDRAAQTFNATTLAVHTAGGRVEGKGSASFVQSQPHYKAQVQSAKMIVSEVKQFWPPFFAKDLRKWVFAGLHEGVVENLDVKADFPPGVLGNDLIYTADNLELDALINQARVEAVPGMPEVLNAKAMIKMLGNHTNITFKQGHVDFGKKDKLSVESGTMAFGNYELRETPVDLKLNLSGKASAFSKMAQSKPLSVKALNRFKASDLRGTAKAKVHYVFELVKDVGVKTKDWDVVLQTNKAGLAKPLFDYNISQGQLKAHINGKGAKVTGKVAVNGMPADINLTRQWANNKNNNHQVRLVLGEKERKTLGIDTGKIITGPIAITLSGGDTKANQIEADLTKARLNLPWIGWSKGKGIAAKASFKLVENKGITSLKNFRLKGRGFAARGAFVLDEKGMRSADLKNVILNRVDSLDIKIKRKNNDYDIVFNARSYDARSIIQRFLSQKRAAKSRNAPGIKVAGSFKRLAGFGGQILSNVKLDFLLKNNRFLHANLKGKASGNAPVSFVLKPVASGQETTIITENAGSVLEFLDVYSKMRGGHLNAKLVKSERDVHVGRITVTDFSLINEPRLAALLKKPQLPQNVRGGQAVLKELQENNLSKVHVDRLLADIEKGPGFLNIAKGQLSGGNASAAFNGKVYDQNNRIKITGTYLPGRALNRLIAKIPFFKLAFGKGKVRGLLGITFKLGGFYKKPKITVNPLSIIAPGVLRDLFKF